MRTRSRLPRRLGLGLFFLLAVGLSARAWLVPALIVAGIRKSYDGHVTIRGWWLDRSSAGVTGLVMHEGKSPSSPVWARSELVSTDLSIGGLLRGRFIPGRILLRTVAVTHRIDADNHSLTHPPFRHDSRNTLPEVIGEDARLTLRQVGRPEMVVTRISASLGHDRDGPSFRADSDDPTWGPASVLGGIGSSFESVHLRLDASRLIADPSKYPRIPFVAPAIWDHFRPTGPIRVVVDYDRPEGRAGPHQVRTRVEYLGASLGLPSLRLVADRVTGRMDVESKVVRLSGIEGRIAGGDVSVTGILDFAAEPDRFALNVGLGRVDLAALPEFWQVRTVGIVGRLTGSARLLLVLDKLGLDLTGSTGSGAIDRAALRGFPLGRLGVAIRGEGLRPPATSKQTFLPQWVGADFEVRDEVLAGPTARLGASGGGREVPISGRLTLKAATRIPFGSFGDLGSYDARGSVALARASIGGLDLGRLDARFDLGGGVLDVADLRGRIAEGTAPETTDPPPSDGPLPTGGFRGKVRAELESPRSIRAEFDGHELPIAGLAAMAWAGPPPVRGAVTVHASAGASGGTLSDPRAWKISGRLECPEVSYRSARFLKVSTDLALDRGRLVLPDLSAHLGPHPLKGRLAIDLEGARSFDAGLDAAGFPLEDLLALLPGGSGKVRISGTVATKAEASGTLSPRSIESRGVARIDRFEVGRIPIGNLPLRWETRGDSIVLTAREVQRFGGRIDAEAKVPTGGGRPIEGTITLARVDTARLSTEVPGSIGLSGLADGQARFRLRPSSDRSGPPVEVDARLSSPDLAVAGVATRSVRATLVIHDGVPRFDVRAEGLGGSVLVKGNGRLDAEPARDEVEADVRAVGLRFGSLWDLLGTSGALDRLQGRGSVSAHLRSHLKPTDLRAGGRLGLEDMTWGERYPLGDLRASFAVAPGSWRIGPFEGEIWGSPVRGGLWKEGAEAGRPLYGVDLRLDQIALGKLFGFAPGLGRRFEGTGGFRASGKSDGAFRGLAEFRVDRGKVSGLPVTETRVAVEWDVRTGREAGGTLLVKEATARVAGGKLHGDARIRIGTLRDFHAGLTIDALDLRVISKAASHETRPIPGRISGTISLRGDDAFSPSTYRGKIDLDLDNASILDVPMLEGINQELGVSLGGIFDDGDLHATIGHRKIQVDQFTLVGPLAQLHASGTIGFDSRIDLKVLINTNQSSAPIGQPSPASNPNVADAARRREQSIDRVADVLAARLVKVRVSGTVRHPVINIDQSIRIEEVAAIFFGKILKIPLRAF